MEIKPIVEIGEIGKKDDKPIDSYKQVYVLFFLIGLVRMLPSSFFYTAKTYWMFKFRSIKPDEYNTLQRLFIPSLLTTIQISSVTLLFIGVFYGHKVKLSLRINGSLVLILLLIVVSAVFININTDSWQEIFFAISLVLVAVTAAITSILDITVSSIISNFPPNYIGSNINGQGFAAICTASLRILSLNTGMSILENASVYFALAICIIACTLILMLTMSRNEFYKHHIHLPQNNQTINEIGWKGFFQTSKIIWPSLVIFTCYVITNNLVFNVTILVRSENHGNVWNDVYFSPVITFFLAAICDLAGRIIAINFNNFSDKTLVIVSILRILFLVPITLLCNAHPRNYLPVLFSKDYEYILILVVLRVTGGYAICISSILIRKLSDPKQCKDGLQIFTVLLGVIIALFSPLNNISAEMI